MTSCNQFNSTEYQVAPELKNFVDNFFYEAQIRGVNLPKNNLIIRLKSGLKSDGKIVNGLTTWQTGLNGDPQVYTWINEEYFNDNNNSYSLFCLESTVFHELGHGVLKIIPHDNGFSIMNPAIRCFLQRHTPSDSSSSREILLNTLFGHNIMLHKQ